MEPTQGLSLAAPPQSPAVAGGGTVIPLRLKLVLAITVVAVFIGGVLVRHHDLALRNALLRRFERRSEMLGNLFAEGCREPLAARDRQALLHQVDLLMSASDVAFAGVEDRDGMLVAASDPERMDRPSPFVEPLLLVPSLPEPSRDQEFHVSHRVRDPAPGGGVCHLVFTLDPLARELESARKDALALALLTGLTVLLLAFFFAYVLNRPLLELVEAARRLRAGDVGARAAILSRDELGEVCQILNGLGDKLQESSVQLAERMRAAAGTGEDLRLLSGELDRRVRKLSGLSGAWALAASLPPERLADGLLQRVREALDAEAAFLFRRGGGADSLVAVAGPRWPAALGPAPVAHAHALSGASAGSEYPVQLRWVLDFRAGPLDAFPHLRFRHSVSLAVLFGGERVGEVHIVNKLGGGRFTLQDQDLLSALAPALAVALRSSVGLATRAAP